MSITSSICIISYNGIGRVKWLLKSIKINTLVDRSNYEIILLDDGSMLPVRKDIEKLCKEYNAKYIQNETNLGIVKSWNRVISEASTNNIALLNDDIIVTEGWLKKSMYFLNNNDNVGAIGFPTFFMLESDMPRYFKNKFLEPRCPATKKKLSSEEYQEKLKEEDSRIGACAIVVGCAFCFKKGVWLNVGKFDEGLVSLYEDYDFGTSLLNYGYQNYQLRTPILYHVLSGTFGSNPQLKAYKLMRESEAYYKQKWGGSVSEVADVLFSKNKKEVLVKYLNKNSLPQERICAI